MSSHREAPEISKDPSADSTDVYAFIAADAPGFVTLVANFIPFQLPYGGPNFFEFADDVVYTINISNGGHSKVDVAYEFRFTTTIRNTNTFLYNTGPINNISDLTWNRPQTYSVTKLGGFRQSTARSVVLASNLPVPPVNVGPRSIPDYPKLEAQAITTLPNGGKVFAGQRSDPFYVDLGSVFDLAGLRPLNDAHLIKLQNQNGVNGLQGLNVHSLVLQVPISDLTVDGKVPTDIMGATSTIGVWSTASRARGTVRFPSTGTKTSFGPQVQVSRLANPLFNELLVPMAEKDKWNALRPDQDSQFAKYVARPELSDLLPVLYPGVFPNLAAYKKPRMDLDAILLTGIPAGVVNGFQNYTGAIKADMVRLNVAVPPAATPNSLGVVGGDLAGFPNGRRLTDDVVTIELRALAGLTIPLVDRNFTPDAAASKVADGTSNTNLPYQSTFPYLANPAGGYQSAPGKPGFGAMNQNP